jgi:HD-GYP domain-containing protein (c-di-GMP phosphodiesterase class II)
VNLKKVKRVVQGIVDQILNEETSLLGLTTIRDYDEYTFTHSVNVCIFSVALGGESGSEATAL